MAAKLQNKVDIKPETARFSEIFMQCKYGFYRMKKCCRAISVTLHIGIIIH